MRLRVLFQFLKLNRKLPKKTSNMELYTIWWQPQLQLAFAGQCPFVNIAGGTYVSPVGEWTNGYYWLEQELTQSQFLQVEACAYNYVCIDVRPGTRPPGSPHGK